MIVIGAIAGVAFVDCMRRHGLRRTDDIERLPGLPLERPPLSKTFILASDDENRFNCVRRTMWTTGNPDGWTWGRFNRR